MRPWFRSLGPFERIMDRPTAGRKGETLIASHQDILNLDRQEISPAHPFDVNRSCHWIGRRGPGIIDKGSIQGRLTFLTKITAGGILCLHDEFFPWGDPQFRGKIAVEHVNLGLLSSNPFHRLTLSLIFEGQNS
jgi:hypothetical protein